MNLIVLILLIVIALFTTLAHKTTLCKKTLPLKYTALQNIKEDIANAEFYLLECEQQSRLLDVELIKLRDEFNIKKNGQFAKCSASLNTKLESWKKLYKNVHGELPTDVQFNALKSKIGIVNTNSIQQ